MGRRRKGRDVNGVVLLDKPAGWSSNQVLQKVRWLFQAKKAGHTGNLDPFATGMLPICLGEASKTAGFMLDASKTYVATARLGEATETGDIEGEICQTAPLPDLESPAIDALLKSFEGDIEQVPPMYSALKHQGQPLYKLARKGIVVERKRRTVTIHSLELLSWKPPELVFRVHCSKGTYVRTLAEDIARALNSCAHLRALRREVVEPFDPQAMLTLEQLEHLKEQGTLDSILQPVDAGLCTWTRVDIPAELAVRFSNGNPVSVPEQSPQSAKSDPTMVRVYGPNNHLLGLAELTEAATLKPTRIMNLPT